ncbi:clusterin associated protein 1 [Arctopsyche grandis]|uniref:clusterin associated protein 1 n=1 Tax=Arctopsyche grandis TaxID=121162 RepID=UPI00406D8CF3
MSFRDLRNFAEHLRALGYPDNISLESFRQPNFPLVAALLTWLVERFDPDAILDGGINTIDERISIIRSTAQFMATKANLKLNTKKLYGADGYAVRELLKITTILYDALNIAKTDNEEAEDAEDPSYQFDISSKIGELKHARQLATVITSNGAMIYDLLGKEVDYKEIREQSISRPLDMSTVDGAVERAVTSLVRDLAVVRDQIDNIAASEASLDSKIEKKKAELERCEKRLQAMQKIKPAYQAEFNSLEVELEKLYDDYVLKLRCIEALKQQLSTLEAAEAEVAEERRSAAKKLIQKYESEDIFVNMSDTDDFQYDESPRKEVDKRPTTRPRTRLRVRTAAGNARGEQPKIFGSMMGNKDDEFSIDDSLGDDDDLLGENLDDEDLKALDMGESDDLGSLGSSDESELIIGNGAGNTSNGNISRSGMGNKNQGPMGSNHSLNKRAPSAKPNGGLQDILSDDDF